MKGVHRHFLASSGAFCSSYNETHMTSEGRKRVFRGIKQCVALGMLVLLVLAVGHSIGIEHGPHRMALSDGHVSSCGSSGCETKDPCDEDSESEDCGLCSLIHSLVIVTGCLSYPPVTRLTRVPFSPQLHAAVTSNFWSVWLPRPPPASATG